jgi:uncharacterized membrane protein YjfL (UPF0719 family)
MTGKSLLIAVIFAAVGMGVFGCTLFVLARFLPGRLWRRAVEEQSLPAAIVLAGMALALGWIVAAAVH